MTFRPKDFLEMGRLAARCAEDKKAKDLLLLDVRKMTSLADFYLLASTESQTQLQAVYDHIADQVKKDYGLSPLHRDGVGSPQWTVLDYGGAVIHLFHESARAFYGLERLWEGAKPIDIAPPEKPAVPRKKTAAASSRKKK